MIKEIPKNVKFGKIKEMLYIFHKWKHFHMSSLGLEPESLSVHPLLEQLSYEETRYLFHCKLSDLNSSLLILGTVKHSQCGIFYKESETYDN